MWIRNHRRAFALSIVMAACGLFALTLRPGTSLPEVAGQGGDTKTKAGEAEIRKANLDYAAAMTVSDLDAVLAFWAQDADYIDEDGKMTRGIEKISALFRKALPEWKGNKVTINVHSLKFIKPEVCLEDGTVEKTLPAGTKESNRFAILWTRMGDKWLISSVRDLPTETNDLPSLAAVQLKDLEWLVGEWADGGGKSEVALKVSWATNKAFLLMDYIVKREGAEPMEVTVRVGWDAHNGRIRSWVFDSTGGFAEAYWRKDGKRWIVGTSGILPDGGIGGATNIYEFTDENAFVWRSTEREVDGQPLADAEVKFNRKTAKK